MKIRIFLISICLIMLTGVMGNALVFADSQAIKERMKSRLPEILTLKSQGVVGENNKGFLEFVGDRKTGEQLVNDENNDRRQVYEAIAQQTGSTVDAVGQRRAIQIAGSANAGDQLQDSSGNWYQK